MILQMHAKGLKLTQMTIVFLHVCNFSSQIVCLSVMPLCVNLQDHKYYLVAETMFSGKLRFS